jgi:hypothetical protein
MSDRYNPYGKRTPPGGYGTRKAIEDSSGKLRRGEIKEEEQLSLLVDPPSGPRVHDVYGALKTLLMGGDNDTLRTIQKMLPDQDITPSTGSLWIKLIELCNNPPKEDEPSDDSAPDTLRIDTEEQGEMGLQPRIASQLKWTIGSFNPQSSDNTTDILESGNSVFELFKRIMIEYSAVQSESMNVSEQDGSVSCLVNPPPSQPLAGYEKILGPGTAFPNFPVPIYFDVGTARWVGELLRESVFNWGRTIKSLSERGVKFGIDATVYVSSRTVKVGVLSLILLFNMAVKAAEEAAGRAGQIMRYILETLFNQKELLFASPFANITNPSDEETQRRRVKRFVMVYLYSMLKLLSVLKLCVNKPGGIEWLREPVRRSGGNIDSLTRFLNEDISTWSVEYILTWGSMVFNTVIDNQVLYFSACPELSEDFMELYKYSLKFQFDLLNIRILRADNNPTKLVTLDTPLGNLTTVINNAGDLRMIDPDTLSATQNLIKRAVEGVVKSYGYQVARQKIEELFVPGGSLENKRDEWSVEVMSYLSEFDLPLPDPEDGGQENEPLSQDLIDSSSDMSGGGMSGRGKRKKRSKKRTKKKSGKRKKAGKRKKSSKRKSKKTKRKSMKQVKEKLINLINSL